MSTIQQCLERSALVRYGKPVVPPAFRRAAASPPQYLTFELEPGGWNNLRTAFETFVVLAAISGRTLVLPPRTYALGGLPAPLSPGFTTPRSFDDFLTLHELEPHVPIISTETFFIREVDSPRGRLASNPPLRTLRGRMIADARRRDLYVYLRGVGVEPNWRPAAHCLLVGKPHPQDEAFCDGRMPVRYNSTFKRAWLLHFAVKIPCGSRNPRCNPDLHWVKWSTAQFYSWIRVTDVEADRHYKRLVRDALQYAAPIVCAAGAIVRMLRREALRPGRCQQQFREIAWGGSDGTGHGFSSLHVRSGDMATFRPRTAVGAEALAEAIAAQVGSGELLYIATDANRSFFEPFRARGWRLRFLKDFRCVLSQTPGLSSDMHGMVEQVVASHGRTFHGTLYSTFSGYILRLRGYRAKRGASLAAWELPLSGERTSSAFSKAWPSQPDFWRREWTIGWEGIDSDSTVPVEPEIDKHPVITSEERLQRATACLRRCLGFAANLNSCIDPEGLFFHFAHARDGRLTDAGSRAASACSRRTNVRHNSITH